MLEKRLRKRKKNKENDSEACKTTYIVAFIENTRRTKQNTFIRKITKGTSRR